MSKAETLTLYLNRAPYGGNIEGIRAATRAYFGKDPRRLPPAEAVLLVALPQSQETRRPDRAADAARKARNRVLMRLARSGVMDPGAGRATLREKVPSGRRACPALAPHLADRVVQEAPVSGVHRLTLKPLVNGIAFDEGLVHPETLTEDRPTAVGGYMPQNSDGQFRRTIRVREALQQSLNLPAGVLSDAIGPAVLMSHLRRAGLDPAVPGGRAGLAVDLGGVGVTLQDLVQLYAGLGRGGATIGLRYKQGSVSGEKGHRILSAGAAWQIEDILSGIVPPACAPRVQRAYKTGTSYGHRDAWAIGFDGRHVVRVWMGRADGTPVPGGFGGDLAARVLFDSFARIKPELEPLLAPPAGTLIVGNARLPVPLQKFKTREALFLPDRDAPVVAFPPTVRWSRRKACWC